LGKASHAAEAVSKTVLLGQAHRMSTESIYNLVPEIHVTPPKPPMYHSKFDPKSTPITGSTFG
jgi:hypothetical protein